MSYHVRFLSAAVDCSRRSPELIQLLDMHTHFAVGTPGRRVRLDTDTGSNPVNCSSAFFLGKCLNACLRHVPTFAYAAEPPFSS